MSKVVWLGEVEWLGEVNCFTKCGWSPGQPDPGGFKQKCVSDCLAQQVPAAEWPAATEFQEPKVPDPKCLTDCENKWGIASGSWNAAELAKCVQACKTDVPSVVQPPIIYTNLPQAETPKTCGPNEILVNGACVPAPQITTPPATPAAPEKKTPWGLIILGGLAVAGAAAWAMGAFGGAGLAGLAENPGRQPNPRKRAMSPPYSRSATSRYGASMGRRSDSPGDFVGPVTVQEVPLEGDYDPGGAYWGGGPGTQPLFAAWDQDGHAMYLRASSLSAARDKFAQQGLSLGAGSVNLDVFFNAYVEAALFTSDDSDGTPLDQNYSSGDFTKDALKKMRRDADAFARAHAKLIEGKESQAGHDFWLTRNGHGAGFWDGDWEEPAASILDEAAKAYGEQYLEVYRKKIHVM